MKKLKAIICIVVIAIMLLGGAFSIVYFSKGSENKKIVVTTFPIYDICREILGNEDDLLLLQDDGVDMHSYQPTANDIVTISNCELFIFIGGHSDAWVGNVIRSADNVNLKELCLIDSIDKLEESHSGIIEVGEHDHQEEYDHEEEHEHGDIELYDEHIWLSIKNTTKMVDVILENLIDVYPHMQQALEDNADEYIKKLNDLDEKYAEVCNGKNTTIVLADRFPFLYLAHDYGIDFLAAFSGCSSDSEASVEIITGLIEKINQDNLNYICVLETSDKSIAYSVISDARCRDGVEILVLNSCQSITSYNIETYSYLKIMEDNLKNFRKAINNGVN